MKLLQVCNVGRIVGGTAACAWSIIRAFPDLEHHVAFLSSITDDTRATFAGATLHVRSRITDRFVRDLSVEAVLLHNTGTDRTESIRSAWTLQYVHSKGKRAAADRTVFCSRWLADQCRGKAISDRDVLYQCVPRPGSIDSRPERPRLIVGRICTPTIAKWPMDLIDFYRTLAGRHPDVDWEFVGCPAELRSAMLEACRGRAVFHAATWQARIHLSRWDALLYHHPTLTESFGRTVAEALRAGCVPIVDARGGFREQVTPTTGWLCAALDEFDRALVAITTPSRREDLSQAARQHGDALFSMAAFRGRLMSIWNSAHQKSPSSPQKSGFS